MVFVRPRDNLSEPEMEMFRNLNRLYWKLDTAETTEAITNLTESCIEDINDRNFLYILITQIAQRSGLYKNEPSFGESAFKGLHRNFSLIERDNHFLVFNTDIPVNHSDIPLVHRDFPLVLKKQAIVDLTYQKNLTNAPRESVLVGQPNPVLTPNQMQRLHSICQKYWNQDSFAENNESPHANIASGFVSSNFYLQFDPPINWKHSFHKARTEDGSWSFYLEADHWFSPRPCRNYIIQHVLLNMLIRRKLVCRISDFAKDLMVFLKNPEQPHELTLLGLAPHQINANPPNSVLIYFNSVQENCRDLTLEEKQLIGRNIQRLYPGIFQQIFIQPLLQQVIENNPYETILRQLQARVFGQQMAVQALASTLAVQANPLENGNRNFMFMGPSGVGKTELARTVATINGNGEHFITLAMNEYTNDTDVSKMFGSATGFVGSETEPALMQKLMRCHPILLGNISSPAHEIYEVRNVVILFDELEKAHSVVKQSLLMLFADGIYSGIFTRTTINMVNGAPIRNTINMTKEFRFKSSVMIGTSNLFQTEIREANAIGTPLAETRTMITQLNAASRNLQTFAQEFLGRFSIIPFGPIPRGPIYQSLLKNKLTIFFEELRRNLPTLQVDMENEPLFLFNLENRLYGDGTQIRRVSEYLNEVRENIIRQGLTLNQNSQIVFFAREERLFVKINYLLFVEELQISHLQEIIIQI